MYADQMIKRCPFCNGKARLRHSIYVSPEKKFEVQWTSIDCPECTAMIFNPRMEEAIRLWNTRKGIRYDDDVDPFMHVITDDSCE